MREVFFFQKGCNFCKQDSQARKKPDLFTQSGDHLQSPARELSSPIILGVRTTRPSNRKIADQYKNTGIVSGSMEKEYRDGDLSKTRSKANGAAEEETKVKMEEENREKTKEESNSVSFEVPKKNESMEGSRERSGSNGSAKSPGTSNGSSKKVVVVRSAPITIGKVLAVANFINFNLLFGSRKIFCSDRRKDFV